MTRRRGPVLALIVGLLAGFSLPAFPQDLEEALKDSYPTNLTMLSEATRAAISELLLGFNAPTDQTLLMEVSGTHEGNWFVENHLLTQLTNSGYHIYLKEASTPGPSLEKALGRSASRARPDTATSRDTTAEQDTTATLDTADVDTADVDTAAVVDSLSVAPPEPEPDPEPDRDPEPEPVTGGGDDAPRPEYVLRFRVVQFEITYPDNFKTSPLGSRKVQRLATVNVMAHLLRGEREDVVWVGSGDVERIDTVPASKLPLLEGPSFPFTQPVLETSNLSSLVEPVLVTGIVAGLIYLFYTNQN